MSNSAITTLLNRLKIKPNERRAYVASLLFHGFLLCVLYFNVIRMPQEGMGNDFTTIFFSANPQTEIESIDYSETSVELIDSSSVSILDSNKAIIEHLDSVTESLETKIAKLNTHISAKREKSKEYYQPTKEDQQKEKIKFKNSFFGAETTENKIVYLLDASSSMQGIRFRKAVSELQQSIKRLQVGQYFSVILYNEEVFVLFAPKSNDGLVEVSVQTKSEALRWLKRQKPLKLTDPVPALTKALSLKPDVILFLSDGELPTGVLKTAKDHNDSQTIIHTISFASSSGKSNSRVLRNLAEQNNGMFRLVN